MKISVFIVEKFWTVKGDGYGGCLDCSMAFYEGYECDRW